MNALTAHGRIASLCDTGFQDWNLGIGDRLEEMALADPEWPANAAALIVVSGGLADLADDCPDSELLELLRHGLSLFSMKIVSEEAYMAAHRSIIAEVLRWGDGVQGQLDHISTNN